MCNSGTSEVLAHIRQLRKLTSDNMAVYYPEWRQEVDGLLFIAGLGSEIINGAQGKTPGNGYKAFGVVSLCISQDVRNKVRTEEVLVLDAFEYLRSIHNVAHRAKFGLPPPKRAPDHGEHMCGHCSEHHQESVQ